MSALEIVFLFSRLVTLLKYLLMRKSRICMAFSSMLVIVFICTSCRPTAPSKLTEEDKQYFKDLTAKGQDEWIRGNRQPFVDRFSEEAIVMASNRVTIVGKDSIRSFVNAFPEMKLEFSVLEIVGTAEYAYLRGTYKVFNPADSLLDKGKFLNIWRKFPGDKWLITHDIFNSDLPLPVTRE
jgi:ketosteroid isomerase-like protein